MGDLFLGVGSQLQKKNAVLHLHSVTTRTFKGMDHISVVMLAAVVIVAVAMVFVLMQCFKLLHTTQNKANYKLPRRILAEKDKDMCNVDVSSSPKYNCLPTEA